MKKARTLRLTHRPPELPPHHADAQIVWDETHTSQTFTLIWCRGCGEHILWHGDDIADEPDDHKLLNCKRCQQRHDLDVPSWVTIQ